MNTRIEQNEHFSAPASEVYELLTSTERFQAMTGDVPADIDSSPGGPISLFGGMITGRTIETVPGERLVQAWRPQPWEPGVYSVVMFELRDDADGCSVRLVHSGFPEGEDEHLATGWHDNYWNPMRAALAGRA